MSVILIASVVTFVLRAAPFVVLKRLADSEVLREIGASMPIGVMVILVFYTLADLPVGDPTAWLPAVGGIVATMAVHYFGRNALVSIVLGVAVYAGLLQIL
ncbi:AzlD domain-containing protein [Gleimia hominis]|uniref:AzlD domain-containing protein n=1 Tax=Gleimia hominis TaxID=595468 RepID=A0ABU3IBJ9_9ACTO|nr:AzlD domain-containing protein [Gleimia hominis]MDT3766595.1 AzlD domain-containing protein [Gleimia hominis]